ncbi:MAG: hypothetical protein KDD04_05165, partial [Sinomicrobium sp.]|nr:hypothetical protein [Sinomicrobium sp.]
MPTTIKLMNWNIEQFGESRAAREGTYQRIAQIINNNTPDLISVIELKTQIPATAVDIANTLLQHMPGKYRYILSYQNLLEMYLFIYDSSKLVPLCLPCGITQVVNNGFQGLAFHLADGLSTTLDPNNPEILCNYFPLMEHSNRDTRPPAAGFFQLKDRPADFFALLAWHNAAGKYLHDQQITIEKLPVSEMRDMSRTDYIQNGFRVPTANGILNIPHVILSGDFNVDYLGHNQNVYRDFAGYTTALIQPGQKTHLHTYDPANNAVYTTSQSLRSAILDNFIIKNSIQFSNPSVYDIPNYLKTSNPVLKKSFRQTWAGSQKGMKKRTRTRVS